MDQNDMRLNNIKKKIFKRKEMGGKGSLIYLFSFTELGTV